MVLLLVQFSRQPQQLKFQHLFGMCSSGSIGEKTIFVPKTEKEKKEVENSMLAILAQSQLVTQLHTHKHTHSHSYNHT